MKNRKKQTIDRFRKVAKRFGFEVYEMDKEINSVDTLRLQDIADDLNYLKCVRKFKEEDYGKFVIIGYNGAVASKRIGKLLQVRVNQGFLGSDRVLTRCCDGKIYVHENNRYQFIDNPEDIYYLNELFSDIKEDIGTPLAALTMEDSFTGFLIK